MPDFPGTSRYIETHPWRYLFIHTGVVIVIATALFVLGGDGPWWLPFAVGALAFFAEGLRIRLEGRRTSS